ncbi:HlyD family efflux transporter periplasmic adaptor subunit [Halarcobacter bivalviorum]|uniref:HlyD family efflux transporter periplasmic adaptor subunit n=1 Tax=Halarcobacter bivalviorum TaxID=663364 RepID=UPI00100A6CF0|nr:HlyD family efflux transporter periplasmic adaptor subunit [Halarcobacter bivalviorum]RXK07078.1 hemolysin secretion protein D [Halarcobacter bivalviorum]
MKKLILFISTLVIAIYFTGCFKKEEEVKFYGNVDLRTVSLAFRVSGKIQDLYFDEGQKVQKGELLAKIDEDLYKQNLNQIQAQIKIQKIQIEKLENGYREEEINSAKAMLNKASITYTKAKKDLHRYEQLLKTNSVSKQNFDDIKLIFDSAKAELDLAKSKLEQLENGYRKEDIKIAYAQLESLQVEEKQAQIYLNDTNLYAPNEGTVLTRAYEVGSIVSQGAPIFELALDKEFWVRSYIDEKYLGLIKPNMEAKVFTDSSEKVYRAKVSFISAQAEFTPKSVQTQELRTQLVYRVRLIIQDADDKIRQGMPVTIEFDEI